MSTQTVISTSSSTDRCLYLHDEIVLAFIDDFMVLPAERMIGNIFQGLLPAVARHRDLFELTH